MKYLIEVFAGELGIKGTMMAWYHSNYELNTSSTDRSIYEIDKSDVSQMFVAKMRKMVVCKSEVSSSNRRECLIWTKIAQI